MKRSIEKNPTSVIGYFWDEGDLCDSLIDLNDVVISERKRNVGFDDKLFCVWNDFVRNIN